MSEIRSRRFGFLSKDSAHRRLRELRRTGVLEALPSTGLMDTPAYVIHLDGTGITVTHPPVDGTPRGPGSSLRKCRNDRQTSVLPSLSSSRSGSQRRTQLELVGQRTTWTSGDLVLQSWYAPGSTSNGTN